MADPIAQYLECYAQPEAAAVETLAGAWPAAIVVPAYRESIALLDGLGEVTGARGAPLIIIVVNRRRSDHAADADNATLLHQLARREGPRQALADHIELIGDILTIDRSTGERGFDDGDGVGLARRIGLDVALALWRRRVVESHWLHTTDADARLPADLLDAAASAPPGAVALTYPYRHLFDGEPSAEARALALYEISLRYYVLGLRHARSPYAFSAIGSTIAVRAGSYADVRGVPRREAGEDFYLLAKLAKHGTIHRPASSPIELRGVRSPRTPFGTAVSVADIRQRNEPFTLYHPQCFVELERWLSTLTAIAARGDMSRLGELSEPLTSCLEALGVPEGVERACAQARTSTQRAARLHAFFDARRTLRLVHLLRDRQFPNLRWQTALEKAAFIEPLGESSSDQEPFDCRSALETQENTGTSEVGVDILTDQT